MIADAKRSASSLARFTYLAMALFVVVVWTGSALAQAPAGSILTIAPGFSPDPTVFSGVAGGPVDASGRGVSPIGACAGWIPTTPSHEIMLSEHFEYLNVAISSAGDTTLVVEGPVGNWCNDDTNGLNPALIGQWAPGRYVIFVGTFQAGESLPYTLTITGEEPNPWAVADSSGTPSTLPPIGPRVLPPASAYTTPGAMPPAVPAVPPAGAVPGTPPATPPATPPGGVTGTPPTTPPGTPPAASWTTPTTGSAGLDVASVAPNYGTLALSAGFSPAPQSLTGTSGGPLQGQALGNTPTGPCLGWVTPNPDHVLNLSSPFNFLRVQVSSAGDTTMVIHGPNGWWCNDDGVGLNPQIAAAWVPGTYRIWIGSYTSNQNYPYTIMFSEN